MYGGNLKKRTHYCATLSIKNIDEEVTVCGWVQRQRDLGQLIFIDLRDRSGIIQLAFDESLTNSDIFKKAFAIRSEFVLCATGIVRERSSKNKNIKTGDIEILVSDLHILSQAETPPFEILDDSNVNEELRLKYRYLDLRRPCMQKNIMTRHKIIKIARDYFDENGFLEIETPILVKSTPEGAKDYIVPSRVFPGRCFALPQSPQLYKQLTMLAGFDRYFQVARCFRDEDLRANRQPEFTQLDLEMSFVDCDDVINMAEGFLQKVFKEILNIDIKLPLRRLSFKEAMVRYGSDKPDTRFGLELQDLTDIFRNTKFKVFASAVEQGGSIRAIVVPNAAEKISRKDIDKLTQWIKAYGAAGLAWTKLNADSTASSSFEKFLSDQEVSAMHSELKLKSGDIIFLVANSKNKVVFDSLGALRNKIAEKLNLIDSSNPDLLWIVDFPLFEYSEEEQRFVAMHHPFTHPKFEDIEKLESAPANVHALAYDIVLNGNEIGGGSIRINSRDLQERMFKVLGFTREEAEKRFGFLMEAFRYGAPPHGGMAFGLDRMLMLMLNCSSIRDVIAFPKVATSAELMSQAPGKIEQTQLDELSLKLSLPNS
ncbi:MAG: aspartate--tRNA ligase [Clostridia bacterium]|nr:aspartate--tRNA ligase [Clostridia bacterium]